MDEGNGEDQRRSKMASLRFSDCLSGVLSFVYSVRGFVFQVIIA